MTKPANSDSEAAEPEAVPSPTVAERHILEAIVRESPAAIALWRGPELIFELVNPTYQAIFGKRRLIGRALVDAAPELATSEFPALIRNVLETGEPYIGHEMLAQIVGPDGTLEDHYYDFKYVRVLDSAGEPYGVFDHAIDVTERVLARRASEQERDGREHLVAALSHDLRTPLNTAKLAAELLAMNKVDADQFARATRRIIDNMDRADAMIRDLLDVSRIRAGEKLPLEIEPCDLVEQVQVALEDLVALYGDRFVLYAPPQLRGYWDCRALRRLVENLASNAAKYGAAGTAVSLTLSSMPNGRARLDVHNHGVAIDGPELPSLFDLFKRSSTAGSQDGWGIGLSLVKGLANAHGGSCSVTSSAEDGTTFSVELPMDARALR